MNKSTATVLKGFAGFYYSWKLAAIVCSLVPFLVVASSVAGFSMSSLQSKEQRHYAEASAVAEETISSIKTVAAFSKQNHHIAKYVEKLKKAKIYGIWKTAIFGVSVGAVYFLVFGSFAVAFWYGPRLIARGELSVQHMMTALFSVLFGAMSIGCAYTGKIP